MDVLETINHYYERTPFFEPIFSSAEEHKDYDEDTENVVETYNSFKTVSDGVTHWVVLNVDIDHLPDSNGNNLNHATLVKLDKVGLRFFPTSFKETNLTLLLTCFRH